MDADTSTRSSLQRHGLDRGAIRSVDAEAQIAASGIGLFRFVLHADVSAIRIPEARPASRADGLWRHTCFEAFIKVAGASGYYEVNFSPSQQWALYRFDAYREGMAAVMPERSPQISVRRSADRLELDALLHLQDLLGVRAQRLQVGLSAVIEEDDGTLCYWALKHPAENPDFHRAEGFLLEFEVGH